MNDAPGRLGYVLLVLSPGSCCGGSFLQHGVRARSNVARSNVLGEPRRIRALLIETGGECGDCEHGATEVLPQAL